MLISKIEMIKMVRSVTDLSLPDAKLVADTYFRIRGVERSVMAMDIDIEGVLELARFVGAINSNKIIISEGDILFGLPAKVSDEDVAKICTNTFKW